MVIFSITIYCVSKEYINHNVINYIGKTQDFQTSYSDWHGLLADESHYSNIINVNEYKILYNNITCNKFEGI